MAQFGNDPEEDLQLLDIKLKQTRMEYEQYFLGVRKREPQQLRGEVQKMVAIYSNLHLKNTGLRFKFNNLRARFFSFKRHWDMTCRKIEEGRYERDVFKANLHERMGTGPGRPGAAGKPDNSKGAGEPELFESYLEARMACGQSTSGITQEKLEATLRKQEAAIRQKTGCDAVRFRVAVENGKTKLKATPIRSDTA